MSDRKKMLIDIFHDTLNRCKDYDLEEVINSSYINKTRGFSHSIKKYEYTEILFWPIKTTEAARKAYELYPESRICMLNFASQRHAGGGVEWGSSAQEESMCRATTLYPVISNKDFLPGFYHETPKIDESVLIYTPDIKIIKDEGKYDYTSLPENEIISADVITCAAPNLRRISMSDTDLYKAHIVRAQNIIQEASRNCDILITGAFGCGAYRNDPKIVAKTWHELLNGQFKGSLKTVVFAIPYDESWDELKKMNMTVFAKEFGYNEYK